MHIDLVAKSHNLHTHPSANFNYTFCFLIGQTTKPSTSEQYIKGNVPFNVNFVGIVSKRRTTAKSIAGLFVRTIRRFALLSGQLG